MTAAALLLGLAFTPLVPTCPTPPFFPPVFESYPVCTPARQVVECGCSECMTWDADPTGVTDEYEIHRSVSGSGVWTVVGHVSRVADLCLLPGFVPWDQASCWGANGDWYPTSLRTMWCVGYDVPTPVEGVSYLYTVLAYHTLAGGVRISAAAESNTVAYVGAPYRVLP